MTTRSLEHRVESLEVQVRWWRRLTVALAVCGLILASLAAVTGQAPSVLRVRGLVVVDSAGRDRIFLGAPVPDPREGKRISPSVGLTVNDSAGNERFGLGLHSNGRFTMGFDAPPHTGDDRNRERITLVADERGGAYVRILDRRTRAQAFLRLGDDDAAYLEFLRWTDGVIQTRRLGFGPDTVLSQAR